MWAGGVASNLVLRFVVQIVPTILSAAPPPPTTTITAPDLLLRCARPDFLSLSVSLPRALFLHVGEQAPVLGGYLERRPVCALEVGCVDLGDGDLGERPAQPTGLVHAVVRQRGVTVAWMSINDIVKDQSLC